MASTKDYYEILGISKNASADEVKQAYRKLAREHHPDMVKDGDKSTAEKRFKEINEAYQVLIDPQKRKMFDQFGSAAFAGGAQNNNASGFGGFSGFNQNQGNQGQWGPFTYSYSSSGNSADQGFNGDFDPFDVFEQFFGFRGFGGQQRGPRKGKNLYYEIRISLKDAIFGSEKEIRAESGNVTIKIPAGARDGLELRFSGKGMPSTSGGQPGDLFLSIKVEKPKNFDIVGENIFIQKEIDFVLAILGGTIDIDVIDLTSSTGLGTAKLKIPEATQFGTKLQIRGKGMPKLDSRGLGDAIVQVYFKLPKKLSKEQRRLLEEFKNN